MTSGGASICLSVALGACCSGWLSADEPIAGQSSDGRALNQLFGESWLQQNAAEICRRARELPPAQRYDDLARWVLPTANHGFRLRGAFRPSGTELERTAISTSNTPQRLDEYPESGWLTSPALDLVQVADELGRLGMLRQQIEQARQVGVEQAGERAALLLLVAIARGDVDAVEAGFEEMFYRIRDPQLPDSATRRWCDLLVLWSAAASPATDHLVTEELFGFFPKLQHYNENVELDRINDYLRLLKGRCQDAKLRAQNQWTHGGPAGDKMQFESFSRVDAATHGGAFPLARFYVGPGGAHKITGHEVDYLAYRAPATTDFEVSCEVATRTGAFTELIFHGIAVKPVDDGQRLQIGGFAKGSRQADVSPPLERIESPTHYRGVVRNGVAHHSINGRGVMDVPIERSAAPWVALRSWRRTTSNIFNVQLSGSGTAPEVIDPLSDTSLSGWASYFDSDTNHGLGNWNAVVDQEGTVQLVGSKANSPTGSFDEGLIRYVRPISWDATLRYEFYWQPDEAAVHPALGRSVFLITPAGVRLHRLTDGRYEQTNLRPDNASELSPPSGTVAKEPNLHAGWNAAALRIAGDDVVISINGQLVARQPLSPENSRVFGFFHYRDRSQAVVRKARLEGDWPRAIPPIEQQPLAAEEVAELGEAAEKLPIHFGHDFSSGMPPELFDVNGDATSIDALPNGIRMGRWQDGGAHELRFCAAVKGDFDIVASYEDLEIASGEPTWHCGIGLAFVLDNPTRDRCAINRRRDRMQGHHHVAFGQKETNAGGRQVWTGGSHVIDESTSGRLRLVRRGTTVSALHAIADSPHFRLIATTDIPPGGIEIQGLRLITDIGRGLRAEVTWTELEVRAESIDFLTVDDPAKTAAMFDDERKRKRSKIIDLTTQPIEQSGIVASVSDGSSLQSDARGATVTAKSQASRVQCLLVAPADLGNEFDVQVDFEVLRLDRAAQMGSSSEIVLQVPLQSAQANEDADDALQLYEASMILRHKANGKRDLVPRVVGRGRGDSIIYLPIRSIPVDDPDQFRIVQRDRTLYYLYSEAASPEVKVIASYPLDQPLNASAACLSTIASPGSRTASTAWKRLALYDVTQAN